MGKSIWYLHHYAGGPGIGRLFRPYNMSKAWQAEGHDPVVISARYNHMQDKSAQINPELEVDGVPYVFLEAPQYEKNGLGRLRNLITYSMNLIFSSRMKKLKKPDIIIASSPHPLLILPARRLAKIHNAKLFFEVRDIWPLSITELTDMKKKHPLIRLFSWVERYAYRVSDQVISLFPYAKTHMVERGLKEDKFNFIPNGIQIDTEECSSSDFKLPIYNFVDQLRSDGKFVVAYTGAFGEPNAMEQLMDATKIMMSTDESVHFVLVGEGRLKAGYQKFANANKLENVTFFDSIPKNGVLQLLKKVDAGFIGWNDKKLYSYGISSNKLYDYMLTKLPIICAVNTPLDPVAVSGCGLSVKPNQPADIVKAIIELKNKPSDERAQMGILGRQYVIDNHDYVVLAKKYSELF